MNYFFLILFTLVSISAFSQESLRRQDTPAGVVITFAGSVCPQGYLLTDGSALSRTTYKRLFDAIGTNHGTSNGTNFFLPDYRGRFLRMVDAGAGRDPDRASRSVMAPGGASGDIVGSIQADMFGIHTHVQDAHGHMFRRSGAGSVLDTGNAGSRGFMGGATEGPMSNTFGSGLTGLEQTAATNQNSGGNETRPKNALVTYCIKY